MPLSMQSTMASGTRRASEIVMKTCIFPCRNYSAARERLLFFTCFIPLIVFIPFLSGCVTEPKTLYSWESYESQVYAYLKGESLEEQISALERDREKIEARSYAIPPGLYAHLGLLYTETGDTSRAIICFETEKFLFPESAAYMDFILNNYGR